MQYQHGVLDTLVYLFDYLVYEKKARPSVDEMHEELGAAGFDPKEVERAMKWLLDLNDLHESCVVKAPSKQAVRLYTDLEKDKISAAGRDCLQTMTELGVIDTRLREIIIQKLMVLDENDITADEIKWVALMAIYNRDNQEASAIWIEQALLQANGVSKTH